MTTHILRQGNRIHPEIRFDTDRGELQIFGWSFSENPKEIYAPAFELLNTRRTEKVRLVVDLKCFNTASTKCLVELISTIKANNIGSSDPELVTWGFDEEDPESMEWGEDLEMVTGVRFSYKSSSTITRIAS
jgi:hypothetical protein